MALALRFASLFASLLIRQGVVRATPEPDDMLFSRTPSPTSEEELFGAQLSSEYYAGWE